MSINKYLHSIILYFFVALPNWIPAEESQWDRFRGPNGSGIDASHELPTKWTDQHIAWQTKLPGPSHSSPVIWGDKIFILSSVAGSTEPPETTQNGKAKNKGKGKAKKKGKQAKPVKWVAAAISRKDGSVLWQKPFALGKFKGHKFNSAASSTAATDANRVIFTWGTADQLSIVSLSHDGELQWQRDMGPVAGGHGYGASPILYHNLVILNNDQDKQQGNLFALNAENGETAWTVARRSQRLSYSVPCVYKDNLVFVNWQHGFTAINPKNGSVIDDRSVFDTDTKERAVSSPIVAGDLVIGTCGFTTNPKHCVAMKLVDQKWTEVWRIEKHVPHIPCVIAKDDLVFLWDDSGIATCVDRATGEEYWKERLPNIEGTIFGSPVSDGRHIYCADESGNIHIIKASKDFEYVSNYALGEGCKTTPAISNGSLYIRTESTLHAIQAPK